MNDEAVLNGALLAISIYEIWLYYQLLFGILIDKRYIKKSSMVILWLGIILIGVSLGINRKLLFFSDSVFILTVVVMVFFSCLIIRRRLFLIVSLVLVYHAFVSLLDFLFAFMAMNILNEKFDEIIYFKGISVQKIIVYIFSRLITSVVVIIIRKSNLRKDIYELRNILFSIGIIFAILVRGYQLFLTSMVLGIREKNGSIGILSLATIIAVTGFIV